MATERPKQEENGDGPPRDWRDHPVEEEADKDIKEGGIEQSGRWDKPSSQG